MKSKFLLAFLVPFIVCGIVSCGAGFKKQVLHSVVDVALAACVAENSGEGLNALRSVCGFGNDMEPIIRRLIEAGKAGNARAAAKHVVEVDAGVADAGKDAK